MVKIYILIYLYIASAEQGNIYCSVYFKKVKLGNEEVRVWILILTGERSRIFMSRLRTSQTNRNRIKLLSLSRIYWKFLVIFRRSTFYIIF